MCDDSETSEHGQPVVPVCSQGVEYAAGPVSTIGKQHPWNPNSKGDDQANIGLAPFESLYRGILAVFSITSSLGSVHYSANCTLLISFQSRTNSIPSYTVE